MEGVTSRGFIQPAIQKSSSLQKSLEAESLSLPKSLKTESELNAALQESLEEEERDNAALQESLKKKKRDNAALQESLKKKERDNAALQESLKKKERDNAALQESLEKKERDNAALQEKIDKAKAMLEQTAQTREALLRALQEEKAKQEDLCAEIDNVAHVADLKKEEQQRTKQLHRKITTMKADRDKDQRMIEKLKNDLDSFSLQHKHTAELQQLSCAKIKALKERVNVQQEEIREKGQEIQTLLITIRHLVCSSDKEREESWQLQRDYEAAVSEQEREAEDSQRLSQVVHQLVSDKEKLIGQIQIYKEALKTQEEAKKQEKAWLCSHTPEVKRAIRKESCYRERSVYGQASRP